MKNVTYLTNDHNSSQTPKDGTDGWKACMNLYDPLGANFTVTCGNGSTPYTRQFAISVGYNHGVALTEVQVYGYNQPLEKQEGVKVDQSGYRDVVITFPKWTNIVKEKPWIYNTLPNSTQNLKYTLSVDGHNPIGHQFETGLSVTFYWPKIKIARTSGKFEVSCWTDEGVCPGPVTYGTFEKGRVCTAPGQVEQLTAQLISGPEVKRNGQKLYKYTINWKEPVINCDYLHSIHPYIYKLNNGPEMFTMDTKVVVQADAGTNASFKVKAQNADNLTSDVTIIRLQAPPAAPGPPLNLMMQTVKNSCVSLTWENPLYSNGKITNYQYKCYDTTWEDVVEPESLKSTVCDMPANTNVSCKVRAINDHKEAGDESVSASALAGCADPSVPQDFNATKIGSVIKDRSGQKKWNYTVSWQKPAEINCNNIDHYVVFKTLNTMQIVSNSSVVLTLDAGSTAEINITAVNNKGLSSSLIEHLLVDEAVPTDGPEITLKFSSTCVNLYINKPKHPNGVIIAYQYWCSKVESELQGAIPVKSLDINEGLIPKVCDLPPTHKITCNVKALNKAGTSPPTVMEGYTKASVSIDRQIEILPADERQPHSVIIKVYPVKLDDSALVLSSYLVLLTKQAGEQEHSSENWTKIANLASALVTDDGYTLYIGDGKQYGECTNSPLEPGASYLVKVAISVQLQQENITIYQDMDQQTGFQAPSHYCQSAKLIENSIHDGNSSQRVGEKVLYACIDGYVKSGGDAILVCSLSKDYEPYWKGSTIVCTKIPAENKGVYIGAGVGGGVLLVSIATAVAVVIIKKRKKAVDNQRAEAETDANREYTEMSSQEPSNYAKIDATDVIVASESNHYGNLANDSQDGEYETL
ncbi:uncharacterized protein [Watersipora subatra]|uniref:uncharacterized protein n=1 Tax=Watersipora subatra TaxID=2589382 RepID=UPI00355C3916